MIRQALFSLFWVICPKNLIGWQEAVYEPSNTEVWALLTREVYAVVIDQSTHAVTHEHASTLSSLERSNWQQECERFVQTITMFDELVFDAVWRVRHNAVVYVVAVAVKEVFAFAADHVETSLSKSFENGTRLTGSRLVVSLALVEIF